MAALEKYGVSTVHEAQGRIGLLASYMRPIYPGASIAGPAVTVSLPPGDNLMIHVAVEVCTPGSILVVAPTSPCTDGYFGELLATSLRAHGVKGLVIEAGCPRRRPNYRNEMACLEPRGQLAGNGEGHARLGQCADRLRGRRIDPGDVIVADDDGVVVVKRSDAAAVAAASKRRIDKEDAVRAPPRQRRARPRHLRFAPEAQRAGPGISLMLILTSASGKK